MIRYIRVLLALAVAAPAVQGVARAQQTAPPPAQTVPASPQASPAPERPTLQLSLQEAVARTLENNVDIAVERYNPEASEQSVRQLQAYYEPLLFSTVTQNSRTSPATNAFAGAPNLLNRTFTYNFGGTRQLQTGGNLRLDFNNNRQSTNSVFSTFNPAYSATFNAQLTQPLLRDFLIDTNRYQIRVSKKNREISDVQLRQTTINTVANVRQLYNNLIYAIDNLAAQRKSLELARRLLEENQIKVKVGTMAPLDVVAAESEVAAREETVIVAEAAVLDAEDAIKRQIFPKHDAATWSVRIIPTDRPTADPVPVDVEAAIRNALDRRTDMQAARMSLENAETGIRYTRNQQLPVVDVVANYGTSGIGGNQITRQGFGGPVVSVVPGGYGNALGDVFSRDYPTWTVGLNLSYPILNRQAAAAAARAQISRDQTVANLRRLEMQVASEVRAAGRAVETNFKRVQSTRAARVLQERRLDAEQKKFAAGMSTNFFVTQAQRDLALAEVLELRAIADYQNSLVNFQRVQEAGGSGGGGTGGGGLTSTLASLAGQSGTTTAGQTASGSEQLGR